MSDPDANTVIDPNATSGVNNANTAAAPVTAPVTASTTTEMKMPDLSSDKKSIGEILNKDSIKGMDLNANLNGLTDNMVAIACIHKQSTESSNVLNNMEKSLKAFTAVKLTNVDSNEIDVLNKFPDTTNAKCEVLDSKNNKNLDFDDSQITTKAILGTLSSLSHWYHQKGRLGAEDIRKIYWHLIFNSVRTDRKRNV